MIQVLNKKKRPHDVAVSIYVGWPNPLGNPFTIGTDGMRKEVIAKYRRWLWTQINDGESEALTMLKNILEQYRNYGDIGLECWCSPEPCHADVILNAILWMDTQEKYK